DPEAAAARTLLTGGAERDLLDVVREEGLTAARIGDLAGGLPEADLVVVGPGPVDLAGVVEAAGQAEILVVVAFPIPSPAMRERGDVVTPIVVARGPEILAEGGAVSGLTSDTTRRAGLVANVDVAPTLLAHLGVPVPGEMTGSPIELRGDPPGSLHERFLENLALRLPLQLLALAVALAALVAVSLFLGLRPAAPELARALGGWALIVISLPIALLPVSVLPRITWVTALALAALLTAAIVGGAWIVGGRDPTAAVALVGAAGVAALLLDSVAGWPAMMAPIIGGGAFDGVRFHGLGNVYAGVLLAGAVLVAAHLRPWTGVALLSLTALFAGLPGLGSNLGAAATLAAAAGLWGVLRLRRRLGALEILIAAGAAIAGTAIVILAHRLLAPDVSHIARAASDPGGLGALVEDGLRRLGSNLELTSRVPAAWLVIVALVGAAWASARRLGHLARDPEWRDACLVLALAALVGFVVNDTGIGLAGLAFVYLAAALAYPALEGSWTRR
ncbi:MAG TPA: hypothetical protein VF058_12120, partial [Actinomycetota bacterium]